MKKNQHVSFDGQVFHGGVYLGSRPSEHDYMPATDAYIFIVTALNGKWKIPIAYFFINSLSGRERANLCRIALKKIAETDIVVTNITCDNPVVNWSMMENLGAKLNIDSMKVTLDELNSLGIPIVCTFDALYSNTNPLRGSLG